MQGYVNLGAHPESLTQQKLHGAVAACVDGVDFPNRSRPFYGKNPTSLRVARGIHGYQWISISINFGDYFRDHFGNSMRTGWMSLNSWLQTCSRPLTRCCTLMHSWVGFTKRLSSKYVWVSDAVGSLTYWIVMDNHNHIHITLHVYIYTYIYICIYV